MNATLIGHNAAGIMVSAEVRLFNSMSRFAGEEGICQTVALPAGSDVQDVLNRYSIPKNEIHLILVNGKDVTPTLNGGVRTTYVIDEGDVIAISGPVPYSWGYGAPVV